MADQVQDRSPDGRPDGDPPETQQLKQPVRGADNGPAGSEHRKAEAEIAAGDVADDLADFA
ncbi:hypothetical protein SAMN05216360_11112 [Methylobacterium phyllostachyos]|uniref:Uncharacterized protein n=2 Tax=Methylobacterium phyllostachyos TaxID=582672 RepID=A0A1H0E1F2_9HYPH|nr:hypothetical protein SAMN05216360_11112 [Methylobacterium phyllostachyos]